MKQTRHIRRYRNHMRLVNPANVNKRFKHHTRHITKEREIEKIKNDIEELKTARPEGYKDYLEGTLIGEIRMLWKMHIITEEEYYELKDKIKSAAK